MLRPPLPPAAAVAAVDVATAARLCPAWPGCMTCAQCVRIIQAVASFCCVLHATRRPMMLPPLPLPLLEARSFIHAITDKQPPPQQQPGCLPKRSQPVFGSLIHGAHTFLLLATCQHFISLPSLLLLLFSQLLLLISQSCQVASSSVVAAAVVGATSGIVLKTPVYNLCVFWRPSQVLCALFSASGSSAYCLILCGILLMTILPCFLTRNCSPWEPIECA